MSNFVSIRYYLLYDLKTNIFLHNFKQQKLEIETIY